ncbi:MAG: VOC family protein [Deltaproteobacteria bacterium]
MKWLRNIIGGNDIVKDIDHIAIVVSDMDVAVEFYTGVLGLRLIRDGRTEGGEKKTFIGTKSKVILAMTEDKNRKASDGGSAGGVNHIAFGVDDVEKAGNILKERGVNFIEEKIGEDGKVQAYHFLDPDGLELEICGDTRGEVPQY